MPGKMDELGLGYAELSKLNPSLIYASLTGFGLTGPLAASPGYDVMASARGGLMGITGSPSEPAKVGVAVTDLSAGLYLHGAILAALFARERDPLKRGQRVDTNLLSVQVASLANIGQNYLIDNRMKGRRMGTAHESIVPYQAFRCRPDQEDSSHTTTGAVNAQPPPPPNVRGVTAAPPSSSASTDPPPTYFICGALNNKQFAALGKAVEELCALAAASSPPPSVPLDASFMLSPDYSYNALRVRNRTRLLSELQSIFSHFRLSMLLEIMSKHDIPSAPINDLAGVFSDPQVVHSGIVREVTHDLVGTIKLTGPPVNYSLTPTRIARPPPLLGQHTQEVIQEQIGASVEQIQQWEREGAIAAYHEIK